MDLSGKLREESFQRNQVRTIKDFSCEDRYVMRANRIERNSLGAEGVWVGGGAPGEEAPGGTAEGGETGGRALGQADGGSRARGRSGRRRRPNDEESGESGESGERERERESE